MKCTEMLWIFCPKYNNAHVELAPASSCDFLLRKFLWVINVRFYVFCHSIVPTNTWVSGPASKYVEACNIFDTHSKTKWVPFSLGDDMSSSTTRPTFGQQQLNCNTIKIANSQMQYQSFNQGVTVLLPSPFPPKFILCIIDHIFIEGWIS